MSHAAEKVLLRVFVGEADRSGHQPLHEAILELLRAAGIAGATVLRGVAGYGGHSTVHSAKLLRLANDLPLVIEAVDDPGRVDEVVPRIEGLMDGGLITLERVTAIRPAGSVGSVGAAPGS